MAPLSHITSQALGFATAAPDPRRDWRRRHRVAEGDGTTVVPDGTSGRRPQRELNSAVAVRCVVASSWCGGFGIWGHHLAPGEACRVEFPVGPNGLDTLDANPQPVVEPGFITVMVRRSSVDCESVRLEVR